MSNTFYDRALKLTEPLNPKFSEVYKTRTSMVLDENQKRYEEWREFTDKNILYPTEFLLPTIKKQVKLKLPSFMKAGKNIPKETLLEKINELSPWRYYFEFKDGVNTGVKEFQKHQIMFRSSLISETIQQILGEELQNSIIVDLGCNAGQFCFDLGQRGAKSVHGVDVRSDNIKRAEFLKSYYNINNVEFFTDDVFNFKPKIGYDVVMNLGLLYHVTQPIELLKKCFQMCKKFMILESICHKEPISAYHVITEKPIYKNIEGKETIELHPTYRAVIDSLHQVGFDKIIEIVGSTEITIPNHSDFSIRCFLAFK